MANKKLQQKLNLALSQFDKTAYLENSPMKEILTIAQSTGSTYKDIEAAAVLLSVVAWGVPEAQKNISRMMMEFTHNDPYYWITHAGFLDFKDDQNIYRTIKGKMIKTFLMDVRQLYTMHISITDFLKVHRNRTSTDRLFLTLCQLYAPVNGGNPNTNNACMRICQLLRWMSRGKDMDFDLWGNRAPELYGILSGPVYNFAKENAIVSYPNFTWKAVLELTDFYYSLSPTDPLQYDIAITSIVNKNPSTLKGNGTALRKL